MTVRVVTGHDGYQWDRIAAVTLPYVERYCGRHGYELWDVPLATYADGRPASWGKVAALARALHGADAAVWIDADVLVRPDAAAIHEVVPGTAWQALVFHNVPEGEIANCGVWLVRPEMAGVLRTVWDDVVFIDHPWWEQAAVLRLLGYGVDTWPITPPVGEPTNLFARTFELDGWWNAHPHDTRRGAMAYARMRHATPGNNRDRLAMLRAWVREWEAVTA